MQRPQQHLQKVHLLVLLLETENISDARLPRAYYDAFQTVIAHGDQGRAKIFAERAYAARLCCEGEDSPATLKMRLLAESPKSHSLLGILKEWTQNETKIPKGLGDAEFEKWLWRQKVWRTKTGFAESAVGYVFRLFLGGKSGFDSVAYSACIFSIEGLVFAIGEVDDDVGGLVLSSSGD
jgi:hypothetical protein